MLAVDTNVVVRYLTGDDPVQSAVARKLVADHPVLILKTVLLETEWVLRSLYGFSRPAICAALRAFTQLPRTSVEDVEHMRDALGWFERGMDFADAVHLACAGAEGCEALATFDRKLAAAARKAKAGKVRTL